MHKIRHTQKGSAMATKLRGLLSFFLSILLIFPTAAPAAAFAEQRSVTLENHTDAGAQATTVTDIRIDGVDKPQAGSKLDDTATVATSEGATWEIAALWVRDDLSFATVAEEGHTYLPVLAFFVPQDYSLEGDAVTVTLSDSLTELFGTDEILSIYDTRYGITYILPASLRHLFVSHGNSSAEQEGEATNAPVGTTGEQQANKHIPTLVDIYCAQTARDKFTDEDLAWLIDLIINYLEPQAVELLLYKFPAFIEASTNNEIGTRIGMYIYYNTGDQDGDKDHENAEPALAYVRGGVRQLGGALKYCYMIGIDTTELVVKDAKGNPMVNPSTGKYMIARGGEDFETLQNTIVHELFHAFMDDYNRTGMTGALYPSDIANGSGANQGDLSTMSRVVATRFPIWFVEGTASSMENVYQYRYDAFKLLRLKNGLFMDVVDKDTLASNFISGRDTKGERVYFPLSYADGASMDAEGNLIVVNAGPARYISGYLATLYLSSLAYQQLSAGDTVWSVDTNGQVVFSSEKIRNGLNDILYQMHGGKTLDQVIQSISMDGNGTSAYTSTDNFTSRFVVGDSVTNNGVRTYSGDPRSIAFVTDFINYMTYVEKNLPNGSKPNGSILFDFDKDFTSPLDPQKRSTSQFYQIVDSNTMVVSSVRGNDTRIGGGKSTMDGDTLDDLIKGLDDLMSAAAKAPGTVTPTTAPAGVAPAAAPATAGPATATEPAAEPVAAPAATEPAATAEPVAAAEPTAAEPIAVAEPVATADSVTTTEPAATEPVASAQPAASEPVTTAPAQA